MSKNGKNRYHNRMCPDTTIINKARLFKREITKQIYISMENLTRKEFMVSRRKWVGVAKQPHKIWNGNHGTWLIPLGREKEGHLMQYPCSILENNFANIDI